MDRKAIADKLTSTETNEKLKKFIVSSREEMWKDEGFLSVVNEYLESSKKALEFYFSAGDCIIWAKETIFMIEYVFLLYERETKTNPNEDSRCSRMLRDLSFFEAIGGYGLGERFARVMRLVYEKREGKAYMRVLEEMEKITIIGCPYKDELESVYTAAYTEQRVVRDKSNQQIKQLMKKLRRIKWRRMASNIMFAIGFFTVPILTVLVMFLPIPSAIEVLVGAFSATIGSIGKWWSYVLNKRENAVEFQKNGLVTIEKNSYMLFHDMETMHRLVEWLFSEIEFLVRMLMFMKKREVLDGEVKDAIEKTMFESRRIIADAEEHSYLGHYSIERASRLVSERLSSVTISTSTLKRRSWMDIFK